MDKTPGLLKLPPELRIRIYEYTIPNRFSIIQVYMLYEAREQEYEAK